MMHAVHGDSDLGEMVFFEESSDMEAMIIQEIVERARREIQTQTVIDKFLQLKEQEQIRVLHLLAAKYHRSVSVVTVVCYWYALRNKTVVSLEELILQYFHAHSGHRVTKTGKRVFYYDSIQEAIFHLFPNEKDSDELLLTLEKKSLKTTRVSLRRLMRCIIKQVHKKFICVES